MRVQDFYAVGTRLDRDPFDLWLPNRKQLTPLFFPTGIEIPEDGLVRWIGGSFLNVPTGKTQYVNIQLNPAYLVTALLRKSKSGNPFAVQITHAWPDGSRFLFSSKVSSENAGGTAQHPMPVLPTMLLASGDSVRIEITNSFGILTGAGATDSFWVSLYGCDIPPAVLQKITKAQAA